MPNAFTFGRMASSATLAIHEGLLTSLNEDEVRGVIGHELVHIKHKDYIVITVLSALPLIAYIVAQVAIRAGFLGSLSGGGGGRGKNRGNAGAVLIAIGVVSFIV